MRSASHAGMPPSISASAWRTSARRCRAAWRAVFGGNGPGVGMDRMWRVFRGWRVFSGYPARCPDAAAHRMCRGWAMNRRCMGRSSPVHALALWFAACPRARRDRAGNRPIPGKSRTGAAESARHASRNGPPSRSRSPIRSWMFRCVLPFHVPLRCSPVGRPLTGTDRGTVKRWETKAQRSDLTGSLRVAASRARDAAQVEAAGPSSAVALPRVVSGLAGPPAGADTHAVVAALRAKPTVRDLAAELDRRTFRPKPVRSNWGILLWRFSSTLCIRLRSRGRTASA